MIKIYKNASICIIPVLLLHRHIVMSGPYVPISLHLRSLRFIILTTFLSFSSSFPLSFSLSRWANCVSNFQNVHSRAGQDKIPQFGQLFFLLFFCFFSTLFVANSICSLANRWWLGTTACRFARDLVAKSLSKNLNVNFYGLPRNLDMSFLYVFLFI